MAQRTYRLRGPTAAQLLASIDPPVSVLTPNSEIRMVVDVSTGWEADADAQMLLHGWEYVGTGDQRATLTTFTQTYSTPVTTVTAHPSWSAPGITASYAGGLLNLLDAARFADLNNLATKCAALEGEVVALRATVTMLLGLVNANINSMKAHGLAG